MITPDLLAEQFYPVLELCDGLVRADDELPKTVFHTYFLLGQAGASTPFVTSENVVDDAFAAQVLATPQPTDPASLAKAPLGPNRYGFTHVLHVPPAFHAELKGRLDRDRLACTLCIPIFEAEFSGAETVDEFTALRRHVVPTQHWGRQPAPKILLRFDNPATQGGTKGDGYVPARFEQLSAEIERMVGVRDGFIEILNFRGDVVELTFEEGRTFRWIEGRNDEAGQVMQADALEERLRTFLGTIEA